MIKRSFWWRCACLVVVLVTQLCLTLCDTMDCAPPVSSIHGILQARILEWVAISFSGDLLNPGIEPELAGGFFTTEPPRKPTTMSRK